MPVLACPMMSCPDRATGRVRDWMGKGWVMPSAARASQMSWRTPKSAKVFSGSGAGVVSVRACSMLASVLGAASAAEPSGLGCSAVFWLMDERGLPGSRDRLHCTARRARAFAFGKGRAASVAGAWMRARGPAPSVRGSPCGWFRLRVAQASENGPKPMWRLVSAPIST
ncbi:Uncharacterised protein [Mycobacteroides abscessus subsp. abscessus]|nr:Uncharacterised protein [Mycobacteroides abscessus subsp. abscessus]